MEIRNNPNDIAWRSAGLARRAILTEDGKFDDCSFGCLMTERYNRFDWISQFENTIKAITLLAWLRLTCWSSSYGWTHILSSRSGIEMADVSGPDRVIPFTTRSNKQYPVAASVMHIYRFRVYGEIRDDLGCLLNHELYDGRHRSALSSQKTHWIVSILGKPCLNDVSLIVPSE